MHRLRRQTATPFGRPTASLAGLLVLAIGSACGTSTDFEGANVVLVTIDTLRADRLGSYGHQSAETPRLDALAGAGIRFAQAISPMPMTLPAHTSLMTSLDPQRHGVRDNAAIPIGPDTTLLAEAFAAAGYDTGAFVGAYVLHSRWGLARGFDTYDDRAVHGVEGLIARRSELRGNEVLDAALPWLRRERERAFFAWIHLYDPHAPYDAPEPYGSRFAGTPYEGEVAFTDSLIGNLVDSLELSDLLNDTILVVTADHGEDLWDHGEPGHGLFVYDSTQHVPLIFRLPGAVAAGRVVDPQVRLIDVAPTILDLVGIDSPPSFSGASLVELFATDTDTAAAYAETMYPRWHFGWQELYALRRDGFKYIEAPRPELYDLRADPGERDNVIDAHPDLAAEMRAELDVLRAAAAPSTAGAVSADAAARLRSLGYIGTAPADVGDDAVLADPKDKIELYAQLVEADSLIGEGDYARAEEILLDIVAMDPRIVDAHYSLGTARLLMERYGPAVNAFVAALNLQPDHTLALADLGAAHRGLGELDAARADFEAVLDLEPDNTTALFNLGEMALESGDPQTALGHFDAVIAIYDEPPGPHYVAGVAALQLGQLERADREFELVAGRAPDFALVHYYRAQVREARGDAPGALQMYRRAVEADPNDYRSWFNVALILGRQNNHVNASNALRRAIAANPGLAAAYIYLGRELLLVGNAADQGEIEAALGHGLQLGVPAETLPLAHYSLAELYRRTGRPTQAEAQMELARRAESALQR